MRQAFSPASDAGRADVVLLTTASCAPELVVTPLEAVAEALTASTLGACEVGVFARAAEAP